MKNIPEKKIQQKFINNLNIFIKSDYFQNEIISLRNKYNIPKNGFILSKAWKKKINYGGNASINNFLFSMRHFKNTEHSTLLKMDFDVFEICRKFSFYNYILYCFIKSYLIFNEKIDGILDEGLQEIGLCRIYNIKEHVDVYIGENVNEKRYKDTFEFIEFHAKTYPVILMIHPSISQRDLISYIKDYWNHIELELNKYPQIKNQWKYKKRNTLITKNNELIYNNRHLPLKKIVSILISKGFENVDEGYVSKIISLEKKQRKEV